VPVETGDGARDTGTVLHAGGALRVRSVELAQPHRAPDNTLVLEERRSVGSPVATLSQRDRGRGQLAQQIFPSYAGSTVVIPLTWQAGDAWLVRINVGQDFLRGAPDEPRRIGVEWMPDSCRLSRALSGARDKLLAHRCALRANARGDRRSQSCPEHQRGSALALGGRSDVDLRPLIYALCRLVDLAEAVSVR
jgi:hypothetical protein